MKRSGYVALLGEPNAGKSTLLNEILEVKLSIVTHKVQTTRRKILGIHTQDDVQVVYLDTPGIFKPKRSLEKAMVRSAWAGAADADVLAILIDSTKKDLTFTKTLLKQALDLDKPTYLVINKVDLVAKESLFELTQALTLDPRIEKVFMISALKKSGVKDLVKAFEDAMPLGPWFFAEDQLSDIPVKVLMAEMTREKIFLNLHQELPYQMTVQTEGWEDFKDGSLKISQVIHVMKEGHKQIILGLGGATLKRIGMQARRDIETFLGRRVHLNLFIRLTEDWTERLSELDVVDFKNDA